MRPGEEAAGSHLAIVDAGVDPEWAAEQVAVERVRRRRPVVRVGRARARAPRGRRAVPRRAGARARARCGSAPGIDPAHRARAADRRRPPHVGAPAGPGRRLRRRRVARRRRAAVRAPGFFYPPTVLVGAPDDALVHLRRDPRARSSTVRVADSFDEALTGGERIGLASVLTPSQPHAQRAWRELPGRTVSVNSRLPRRPRGRRARAAGRRHPHQGRPLSH